MAVLKLFIADINTLLNNSHDEFHNIKYKKVETQGTVTKFNRINDVLHIELTDATGALKDMVFVEKSQCPKIYDNFPNTPGMIILNKLYNENLENRIKTGDIITVVGALISGVFHIDRFYKISIVDNTLWMDDVLNLYKKYNQLKCNS